LHTRKSTNVVNLAVEINSMEHTFEGVDAYTSTLLADYQVISNAWGLCEGYAWVDPDNPSPYTTDGTIQQEMVAAAYANAITNITTGFSSPIVSYPTSYITVNLREISSDNISISISYSYPYMEKAVVKNWFDDEAYNYMPSNDVFYARFGMKYQEPPVRYNTSVQETNWYENFGLDITTNIFTEVFYSPRFPDFSLTNMIPNASTNSYSYSVTNLTSGLNIGFNSINILSSLGDYGVYATNYFDTGDFNPNYYRIRMGYFGEDEHSYITKKKREE